MIHRTSDKQRACAGRHVLERAATPTRSGWWRSSPVATVPSPDLLAEMLDRQPPDVQDGCVTDLLDRVNGELADLMTGLPGSNRFSWSSEDSTAVIVSLDPGRAGSASTTWSPICCGGAAPGLPGKYPR